MVVDETLRLYPPAPRYNLHSIVMVYCSCVCYYQRVRLYVGMGHSILYGCNGTNIPISEHSWVTPFILNPETDFCQNMQL